MDTGKLPPVKVTDYTVSHTFDTYKNGAKSSHFVSMRFSVERPVTPEEAEALAFRSSMVVTRATYYQALARGAITVEEANELIAGSRESHEHIFAKKLLTAISEVKE